MSDRRDQQLHFRVSKPELERIRNKMESSGILSIGSYLRKMALDGYCLYLDLPQLRRMAYLLRQADSFPVGRTLKFFPAVGGLRGTYGLTSLQRNS